MSASRADVPVVDESSLKLPLDRRPTAQGWALSVRPEPVTTVDFVTSNAVDARGSKVAYYSK